ncbi:hypothetical protein TBLA_0C03220 [Henningerozyma blattae CBS 6284]|uniref:Uncharacterized protein n=1 Tax=Henningerozyma blattae (strain ATCC 34711 / CBS 6284 / DSM 70876 / NBRC 10599 / NRRL Y-10934 / UCD 77-7) TaxID=1071380 RepID=I2H174_HENB6|nr:hypothetical protein TBLA_0C03220 [Tetrapisispora blattae CBS 6284]CCH60126.1 hypothetical protein TBLA_0C03220 [Tetrapisispora blattae CBS 6284]
MTVTKHIIKVNFILFDLDGTLVNTTESASRSWTDLCIKENVDPKELLSHSHGVKSQDIIAKYFPTLDNSKGQISYSLERAMVDKYSDSVVPVTGSVELLSSLLDGYWCIVTSGPKWITNHWLEVTDLNKINKPAVFLTSELVPKGKPNPMGYQMGLEGLKTLNSVGNNDNLTYVVFEDAPAGIKAGKAMGAKVVGITTSYDKQKLIDAGADYVINDLSDVEVLHIDDISKGIKQFTMLLDQNTV